MGETGNEIPWLGEAVDHPPGVLISLGYHMSWRPLPGAAPPVGLVWLLPAVPETAVIFDLVEGGVEAAELVSDTLDEGPHIAPIAVGLASGDETLMAQPVVACP